LPKNGIFEIAQSAQLSTKFLSKFAPATSTGVLIVADLTGHNLKRLGGDNSITSEYPYDMTQLWSAAVHAHPAGVDAIVFVSRRQLNTNKAVVVLDRAASKIGPATCTILAAAPGFARTKSRLGIREVY
jgi:hypothetical protein